MHSSVDPVSPDPSPFLSVTPSSSFKGAYGSIAISTPDIHQTKHRRSGGARRKGKFDTTHWRKIERTIKNTDESKKEETEKRRGRDGERGKEEKGGKGTQTDGGGGGGGGDVGSDGCRGGEVEGEGRKEKVSEKTKKEKGSRGVSVSKRASEERGWVRMVWTLSTTTVTTNQEIDKEGSHRHREREEGEKDRDTTSYARAEGNARKALKWEERVHQGWSTHPHH